MARRLIAWVGGAAVVGFLLLAYLHFVQRYTLAVRRGAVAEGSQAAARDNHWSHLVIRETVRLDLSRQRLRVEGLLEAQPAEDSSTLVVAIDATEWQDAARSARLRQALRDEWRALGLGVTKVAVGVVVVDRPRARAWGRGLAIGAEDPSGFYLLPDSLAPATCVAVVVAPPPLAAGAASGRRSLESLAPLWLGPCAFYARFGVPGARVARWLGARDFDLALAPAWNATPNDRARLIAALSPWGENRRWYWDLIYWMPSGAVGCLSGRAEVCRAELVEGDGPSRTPPSWVVVQSDNMWRFTRQRIAGGDHLLGAVARAAGPRRFQEFWRTTLPVDSALTLALGTPVGEWTAKWQRQVADPPRPGPAPRWGDLSVSAVVVVLVLAAAALNARRRSVA